MESLSGGEGYWFKSYNDISLIFEFDSVLPRVSTKNTNDLAGFEYNQSSQQAFYFIRNIESVLSDDWIMVFNESELVGYRQWNGEMTDVPAMGKDGFEFTSEYCETGNMPTFKLYRESTGELIDLYGTYEGWSSNNISVIDNLYLNDNFSLPNEIAINKVYPNPFNPITNIDFYLPYSSNVEINILNINGRKVMEIVNDNFSSGNYNIQVDGSDLSSGIYFIELTDGFSVHYSKIILLK